MSYTQCFPLQMHNLWPLAIIIVMCTSRGFVSQRRAGGKGRGGEGREGRGGQRMINTSTDRYQHQNIKDSKFIPVLPHHPCVQLSPVCAATLWSYTAIGPFHHLRLLLHVLAGHHSIDISWCKGHWLHNIIVLRMRARIPLSRAN